MFPKGKVKCKFIKKDRKRLRSAKERAEERKGGGKMTQEEREQQVCVCVCVYL